MVRELVMYQASSNVVEVRRLRNTVTETYLDGTATVTVSLADAAGDDVTGESWPKALDYVAASEGVFRVALAAGIGIVAGQAYEATLHAQLGSLERTMRLPVIVKDD